MTTFVKKGNHVYEISKISKDAIKVSSLLYENIKSVAYTMTETLEELISECEWKVNLHEKGLKYQRGGAR